MAVKLRVKVENLSDTGGVFMTPTWVASHDGSFDFFDMGSAANASLESLAEDGNLSGIQADFSAADVGTDGVITGGEGVGGILDPGEMAYIDLDIDRFSEQYFSFASMVIPSNDAFVGNDNPYAYRLFDDNGDLTTSSFIVEGNEIWDAGTEQNTELDAAFLNQSAPNTGLDENGMVHMHQGFNGSEGNPDGTPLILGGTTASGATVEADAADFTQDDYYLAKFSFEVFSEINGTDNMDVLQGMNIDDVVEAGAGNDTVFGLDGDDKLYGGNDNDTLMGGNGIDRLFGDEGNDFLYGGDDVDILRGGAGNDTIFGGNGNDAHISGGEGDDLIFGGAGNDLITGSEGKDIIFGGMGADTLYGGQDADSFHFETEHDSYAGNVDTIRDFQVGLDDINLVALNIVSSSAVVINDQGAGLYEVAFGDTGLVNVQTTGGTLSHADFTLAA